MSAGAPGQMQIVFVEQVASLFHMRPVVQFEGVMVHAWTGTAKDIDRVMVAVAAQEGEEVADPVGHPEAENVDIEVDGGPFVSQEAGTEQRA